MFMSSGFAQNEPEAPFTYPNSFIISNYIFVFQESLGNLWIAVVWCHFIFQFDYSADRNRPIIITYNYTGK